MQRPLRLCSTAALFAVSLLIPAAWADNENLAAGKKLFEEQKYREAQETLSQVKPDELTQEEREELDRLLEQLPRAIQGAEKAAQNVADADKAYADGKWDAADRLYRMVVDSPYANSAQREHASKQRERIVEKKQLAEAARPAAPAAAQGPPAGGGMAQAADQPLAAAGPQPEPPRQTIVDEMRQRDELLWQRAVAKMEEAIGKARAAMEAGTFDEAQQQAELAVQVIEAARGYAQPPSKYEVARARAQALKREVDDRKQKYEMEQAAQARAQIAESVRIREESLQKQRQEKLEQLFKTARQLAKERHFRDAAEAMRQALYIDASSAEAQHWLDQYEDFASFAEQREAGREYDRQMQSVLLESDRTRIPWPYDVLYPRNWPEISARRDGVGGPRADEDFELNRRLEDLQREISLEDQPFDQVIDYLGQLNQMNIAVDWQDLEANGVERDTLVSLKLKEVRLRTVLQELLTQVGGDVLLGFAISDGLLRIATREKLSRDKFILVYDIRDLIVNIPRFTGAPAIDPSQISASAGVQGASGPQTFFSAGSMNGEKDDSPAGKQTDPEVVDRIMEIVRNTVEPDSWSETGAGDGAMRELNGQLIVYNTSDAHRQVRDLLKQLRDSRALMIAVESRFLIVASNFLEEIGVDIDFVFNAGTAGFDPAFNSQQAALIDPFTGARVLIPRPLSQAGLLPAIPGLGGGPFTTLGAPPFQPFFNPAFVPAPGGVIPQFNEMTPIPVGQNSINLTSPTQINTGIPGSLAQAGGPALSVAGSYLDNLQVDFLIRATQAHRRSSIAQAPRLMLFNGQRAWVAVVRNRSYVSTVTPTVAEGAVAVAPVVANAPSGTVLDVEGTIASNKKYVTLTVRTSLANEPSFTQFQVQRGVAAGGAFGGGGANPDIFILLPDQEIRGVRTTVSVPDGGTVLLGGLKQVGEVEIEAGVPILSKIPILKRAFTNATTIKDTQTLLILLKAKILIQEEAEQEAFPTLSSSLQP